MKGDSGLKKMVLFFLIVFPFSAFLIPQLDIWHGQGYIIQGAILILYCAHLFKKNKPLALLLGWAGLLTLNLFVKAHIETKQYAVMVFLPFFNLLNIVIFFDLLTSWVDKETYKKFFKYFVYTFLVVAVYSLLQEFGLDQFYRSIDASIKGNNRELVGVMGNSMHHSHFLVIGLPVLFILKGWVRKLAILFIVGCIVLSGSSSGLLVALAVVAFGQVFLRIYTLRELILLFIIGLNYVFWSHIQLSDFAFDNGRIQIWKDYFPIFKAKPITGWGMGIVNVLAQEPKFLTWRHLHLEYYHLAVELGLIGLSFVVWGIIDYYRRFMRSVKDELSVISASIFLAFCLASLFGYPAHLWVLAILGITAYSYQYLMEK